MITKYYSTNEVALQLDVTVKTLYNLINRGEIKCTKIGRHFKFSEDDIKEYIKTRTRNENAYKTGEEINYPTVEDIIKLMLPGDFIQLTNKFGERLSYGQVKDINEEYKTRSVKQIFVVNSTVALALLSHTNL